MIRYLFETCISLLKLMHKSQFVSHELLTEQDYSSLKQLATTKAESLTQQIFKGKPKIEFSLFVSSIDVLDL